MKDAEVEREHEEDEDVEADPERGYQSLIAKVWTIVASLLGRRFERAGAGVVSGEQRKQGTRVVMC